jgi:hypothetical protein
MAVWAATNRVTVSGRRQSNDLNRLEILEAPDLKTRMELSTPTTRRFSGWAANSVEA